MSQERTEEQILTRAPIKAKFGEKEYDLPILPVLKMVAWRKKLIEASNSFASMGVDLASVGQAFAAIPEKLVELVFDYAPGLPREEVLESATEEQFAAAFSQIVSVAFPFMRQLTLLKTLLMASQSVSVKSTNSTSPSTASHQIM